MYLIIKRIYLVGFHMHFQHARPFETSKANLTLWLFFAIGLNSNVWLVFLISFELWILLKNNTFIQFEWDFIWVCSHLLCLNSFRHKLHTNNPGYGHDVWALTNSDEITINQTLFCQKKQKTTRKWYLNILYPHNRTLQTVLM